MVWNLGKVVREDAARGCACVGPGRRPDPEIKAGLPLPLRAQVPQPREAEHDAARHAGICSPTEDSAYARDCGCGCPLADVKKKRALPRAPLQLPTSSYCAASSLMKAMPCDRCLTEMLPCRGLPPALPLRHTEDIRLSPIKLISPARSAASRVTAETTHGRTETSHVQPRATRGDPGERGTVSTPTSTTQRPPARRVSRKRGATPPLADDAGCLTAARSPTRSTPSKKNKPWGAEPESWLAR